jgi:hypothetical protein
MDAEPADPPPTPTGRRRSTGSDTAPIAGAPRRARAAAAPVPEEQLPGHHPPEEQDRPGPERLPHGTERHFPFVFDRPNLALGLPWGITPWTTGLTVTSSELVIRYGPWSLRTPLANIAATEASGPYRLARIAGPPRISLTDRGVSFATRCYGGTCILFRHPVPAILPWHLRLVTHPGATVTVDGAGDLERLLAPYTDT